MLSVPGPNNFWPDYGTTRQLSLAGQDRASETALSETGFRTPKLFLMFSHSRNLFWEVLIRREPSLHSYERIAVEQP